jgi:DNA helicase-2/ATP-dependent DNA helicase PcrA
MDIAHQIVTQPTKLSKEQSDAVLAEDRFIKVVAGAGAGKTETLTRRIAYLLLETVDK